MENLSLTLKSYGGNPDNNLRRFDQADDADLLSYATLLTARVADPVQLQALLGVYEWQGNPLVFLVDGDAIQDDEHFRKIRRRVALRGEAAYLGVVRPGQLVIHHLALDEFGRKASELRGASEIDPRVTLPWLANSRPEISSKRRWVSQVVLQLLRDTIRKLMACKINDKDTISGNDAISLAGRALFLRFLGDRQLLDKELGADTQLFDDAERAERASNWLDAVFNGDFLPLSEVGLFRKLPDKAFYELGNILHRAPQGQLHLDWQEDWAHLDFAHIPVGVLSEAYEHYMREHAAEKQKKEGGYYASNYCRFNGARGFPFTTRRWNCP